MMDGDSLYPPDWRESGAKDWHRIDVMLRDGDAEGAAFFLQQCLEKFLKAYLLSRGWKLRKIHQLDALLDDAVARDESLGEHRSLCERVSGYYFVERYPQVVSSGLTTAEIETDRAEARRLVRALFPDERLP